MNIIFWGLSKCKLHWVACKVNEPSVVYTSIHIRKIMFIAYIYIRFNKNLDEKSYISAKIEAVNIYTPFFCYLRNNADVQSDCREPWFILTSMTSRSSMLLLECKLHYVLTVGE